MGQLIIGTWKFSGVEKEFEGELRINENICELRVVCDTNPEMPFHNSVVYSIKTNMGEYTMYECEISYIDHWKHSESNKDGIRQYVFIVTCQYLIIGASIALEEDLRLSSLKFKTSQLFNWFDKEKVRLEADTLEYKVKISADFVELYYNVDTIFKESINELYKLNALIIFLTFSRTYITKINGVLSGGKNIEIIQQINTPRIKNKKLSNLYIVSPEILKKNFNSTINLWTEKVEKLEPIIDLYLSFINISNTLSAGFLTIIQALEAFHRLTRDNKILPANEFKKKREKIVQSVPSEYKEEVAFMLNYSNEPNLNRRLEELFEVPNSPYLFDSLELEKSREQLIKDIKNTRNYYTHFSQNLKKKVLKGEDLFLVTGLLVAMLNYYLLEELAVDEEFNQSLVRRRIQGFNIRNSYNKFYENNDSSYFR
ncbi:HEPN domain-containing protein [Desemzia incerta]|uniref:HEPN domain-containing protein n=1 Tax=Desemzia incerta TaxID=82801 RepID=UPI001660E484|nr:HEPN domain-containing protein [Desemzia incerta]